MPVQLEFGDPERGDEVIIPVAPEALPEDDRGAYPEDTCEADTWKRFDEYPQKMARATAHLDAIPSDWKPPVPLHDKVAAAKKKMGRARPQMVPEEEPDDEDFSHLWAVEDPVLTRPPEPEPRERRADSRTDEPLEKPRPTSREKEPPKEERIVKRSGGSSSGRSCEAAIASYREKVTMGDDDTPADITAARYGAVLNRGSYFSHCGVPESTAIHICAAVQNGRAVGVTVTTTPRSRAIERCVAGAVRGLGFPSHPRMDVTRTTFE